MEWTSAHIINAGVLTDDSSEFWARLSDHAWNVRKISIIALSEHSANREHAHRHVPHADATRCRCPQLGREKLITRCRPETTWPPTSQVRPAN